ncbi:MAG: hypothetical protein QOE87_199 [Gaiellales bacterium]|jgi:hypothetical protein|nr:hypothetical protein [Gaiellales bacterium]
MLPTAGSELRVHAVDGIPQRVAGVRAESAPARLQDGVQAALRVVGAGATA